MNCRTYRQSLGFACHCVAINDQILVRLLLIILHGLTMVGLRVGSNNGQLCAAGITLYDFIITPR